MKKLLLLFLASLAIAIPARATLWSFFQEQKESLPSFEERTLLAAEYGIWGYKGTAEQNQKLEEILRIEKENVGYSVVSRYRTTLQSSMTSAQATVPVASITSFDGTTLTMDLLGPRVFLTIEPGTAREEIVMCTAISSSQFSSCTRGLAFTGTSTTAVAANQKAHNAGSVVVMSNVHYVYEQLVDKDSTETLEGLKTVSSTELIFGTGVSTTLKFYWKNSSATSTSMWCGAQGGILVCSEDGTNTFRMRDGGSGVSAGKGISITSGLVNFNPGATSTSALGFSGSSPIVALSTGGGIQNYADGLAISTSTAFTWSGLQTFNAGILVQSSSTFTASTTFSGNIIGMSRLDNSVTTTGEAIDGSGTPKAVAMATSTGLIYQADANNVSRVQFVGFITTNVASGGTPQVITEGIVSGFSGLTVGATYYVTDTAGSISTNKGTTVMPVGTAISATKLLVHAGRKVSSGTISHSATAGNNNDITITPGFQYSVLVTHFVINSVADSTNYPYEGTAIFRDTTLAGASGTASDRAATALTSTNISTYVLSNTLASLTPGSGTNSSLGTHSITSVTSDSFASRLANTAVAGSGQTITATIYYTAIE